MPGMAYMLCLSLLAKLDHQPLFGTLGPGPGPERTAEIESPKLCVILLLRAKKTTVLHGVPSRTSAYSTEPLTLSCIFSGDGALLGQAMSVVTSQGTVTSLNILLCSNEF